MVDNADQSTMDRVLTLVPQQSPFRFINKIIELSDDHIVGQYTYSEDEFFYKGHFPGNPITPGVILIETMAQTGVVALGIYLTMKAGDDLNKLTVFTDGQVEFAAMIKPNETVTIRASKIFWRRGKLKSRIELLKEDGSLAAFGELSGMGVIS
ncbi:MAG: beta-hydroxyacyl-ACP dehydratase [Leptonema sp. (in: Bacteria)]|nr:beta-hydroxyacyl-ACP dehydratase [Leptonema sp. (in: bacteria)]